MFSSTRACRPFGETGPLVHVFLQHGKMPVTGSIACLQYISPDVLESTRRRLSVNHRDMYGVYCMRRLTHITYDNDSIIMGVANSKWCSRPTK